MLFHCEDCVWYVHLGFVSSLVLLNWDVAHVACWREAINLSGISGNTNFILLVKIEYKLRKSKILNTGITQLEFPKIPLGQVV